MSQGRGMAGSQCQHAWSSTGTPCTPQHLLTALPAPEAMGHLLFGTKEQEGGSRLGDGSRSHKTQLEPLGEEEEMLRGFHVSVAGQGAAWLCIS